MCSDALEFDNDVYLNRKYAAIIRHSKQSTKFASMLFDAMTKLYVRLLESNNDEEKRDYKIFLSSYEYDFIKGEHIFSFTYYDKETDELLGIANIVVDSKS